MTENRFPSFDLPSIDLPSIDAEKVNELKQRLSERLDSRKGQMDDVAKTIEARISAVDERIRLFETKLDNVVDQVKDRLPTPAGEALTQAQNAVRTAREQVRGRLVKAA